MDAITLALAKAYTDNKGRYQDVFFDATPTKMDLSATGMGYAYLLTSEDLFSRAYGQNVHYEYILANGTAAQGVLNNYTYLSELSTPAIYGAFTLLFNASLGGTGVSFNYADVGEITNLKLWTEYSENKPYYVTGYRNDTDVVFLQTDQNKAIAATQGMMCVVRYVDSGGNLQYLTPLRVEFVGREIEIFLSTKESASFKSVYIADGQPVKK